MKTLLLAVQYPPFVGGVPNFYYHMSKHFPNNAMVIFTSAKDGAEAVDKELDFPVYRTRFLRDYKIAYKLSFILINIPIFFSILWLVLKEKIDNIILGNSGIAFLFMGYLIKLILKKDYVIFLHGDVDSPDIKLKSDKLRQFFIIRLRHLL